MRRHPRAKRLQIILDLAEREQEKRLRAWGELQQQLQSEQQQRQQLESYHQEYQQQISSPTATALSSGQLHTTLGFMGQVKQALNAQKERLTLLEQRTEQARNAFLQQQGKTQALIKLMDKLDQEHDLEADKELQKQADEWANRAASLRMNQSRN